MSFLLLEQFSLGWKWLAVIVELPSWTKLPANIHPSGEQAMAQVVRLFYPMWGIWIELLAPGLGQLSN